MSLLNNLFKKVVLKFGIPVEESYTGAIITPRNVRIIDLEQSQDHFTFKHLLDIPTDGNPYEPESIEKVNKVCKENGLTAKTICNLVTDKELFMRHLVLPAMAEENIVESLRFSEKESVPFPIGDASIDVMVFAHQDNDDEQTVMMAALDGKIMTKYHNFFKKSIFKHSGIATASSALLSIMEHSTIIDQEHPVPIISIGGTITGIYIFQDGDLKFTRDIQTGGRTISEELAGEYEVEGNGITITANDAEDLKDFFGIPGDEELLEAGPKGITGEMMRERLQPSLDKMVAEYGRSIDFFKNEHQVSNISTVYLIGNTAHLKNLPQYLSDALGYSFITYNPFDDFIEVEDEELKEEAKKGAGLTITIGLALDHGKHLNLLPEKLRYTFEKFIKELIPYAVAVSMVLLMVTSYIGGTIYQNGLAKKVDQLKNSITQLNAEQKAAEFLRGEIIKRQNRLNKINARLNISPDIKGNGVDWIEFYSNLANLLPFNIKLERILVSFQNKEVYSTDGEKYKQQLSIEGVSRGSAKNRIKAIRELLQSLKKAPYFPHVSLISSEEKVDDASKSKRLHFKIASDIKEKKR